jgi:hypothetical protein
MPPLTDPVRTKWYLHALENWTVGDYITWEVDALRWVRAQLSAYSTKQLGELLHRHVQQNGPGCVDEQAETRPHWRDRHEFHHDLRVQIEGRLIYFETRLVLLRHEDAYIAVVNVHDA